MKPPVSDLAGFPTCEVWEDNCTVCSSHLFPEPTHSNSIHRVEISDGSPDLQGTWQQAGCDKLPAHLATEHSVEMPRETNL